MKPLFLLLFPLFISAFYAGVTPPPVEEIAWSADRPLAWADFKGEPRSGNLTGAVTYATIRVSPQVVGFWNQRVEVRVEAIFRCDRSWAKDRAKESTYLLNHEQRHFDIAEVYAARIREALAQYRLSPSNYKGIRERVVNQLFEEYVTFDEAYDSETVHGLNADLQESWNQDIDRLLKGSMAAK